MDEVRAWMAKAAITELITRYAALNDAGDWDALATLYTEDGRMNRPTAPDDFIVGRTAIVAAFRVRPRRAARHIVAYTLVTLDDESVAHASTRILLFTGGARVTPCPSCRRHRHSSEPITTAWSGPIAGGASPSAAGA
jgi:hypothetical protein